MQSPAHFVVGAAICRYVRWKPLGLALAFGSHFVLDAIPHFEDPSLLPEPLAHWAGHHWTDILVAAQGVVVLLAVLTLLRWRRRDSGGSWGFALFLVFGGLLAASPDYFTQLLGPHSLIARMNQAPHHLWVPAYYRLVMTRRDLRPLVVSACLLVEGTVLATGAWALLRTTKIKIIHEVHEEH